MNLKSKKGLPASRQGFTLIEILIVVSIMGLLASVILVGLGGFRSRGRDARRVADLKSIQNGLELYYAKSNRYPDNLAAVIAAGIGVNRLPKDPTTSADYFYSYETANKQGYILGAVLDTRDAADPIYQNSYQGAVGGYTGTVAGCAPASGQYCVQF